MAPNTQQDVEKDSQSNTRSENLGCTKYIIQDLLKKQVLLSNLENSLPPLNPSKRKWTMNFKYKNGDLGPLVAKRPKLEGTLIQEEPEHVKTNEISNKTSKTSSKRKRLSLLEKNKIIKDSKMSGFDKKKIEQQYGISRTCLLKILKNKSEILKAVDSGVNQNSKSMKKSPLIGQVNLQSSLSNQTNGVDEKNTHIEVYDFMQLSSEKAIIFKIKNEPIDQEFSLPSTNQENTLVKSETIDMKTDLKTEVKQENFGEFEAREQVGIDLVTSKDFNCPFAKSVLIKIKTEVKSEIKEEPSENFEAREQAGIDFITSKDFDDIFNESEFLLQKTDFAMKHRIREEQNESNGPLKKFKQDCLQSNNFAKSQILKKTLIAERLKHKKEKGQSKIDEPIKNNPVEIHKKTMNIARIELKTLIAKRLKHEEEKEQLRINEPIEKNTAEIHKNPINIARIESIDESRLLQVKNDFELVKKPQQEQNKTRLTRSKRKSFGESLINPRKFYPCLICGEKKHMGYSPLQLKNHYRNVHGYQLGNGPLPVTLSYLIRFSKKIKIEKTSIAKRFKHEEEKVQFKINEPIDKNPAKVHKNPNNIARIKSIDESRLLQVRNDFELAEKLQQDQNKTRLTRSKRKSFGESLINPRKFYPCLICGEIKHMDYSPLQLKKHYRNVHGYQLGTGPLPVTVSQLEEKPDSTID